MRQSTNFVITQQVDFLSEDFIIQALKHKAIDRYAYCLHDQDIGSDGVLKAPHHHIYIRLKYQQTINFVSRLFEIEPQYVEFIKGRVGDVLAYLNHENATGKFQYPVESIISNFDIEDEKANNSSDRRIEEITALIVSGECREYNLTEYISANEFVKYRRKIDSAFEYRRKQLMLSSDRDIEVTYIYGHPGTGKTTFAKKMATDNDLSYFVSGSSNDILDGYQGQDVLIIDDLRPYSLSFTDLLKLIDPYTGSLVKSRYKNKFLECQQIYITSILTLEEFYFQVPNSTNEPISQLYRRIGELIKMTFDDVQISVNYNNSYEKILTFHNPIQDIIQADIFDRVNQVKDKYKGVINEQEEH